ncbi:hypothetical protein NMY22_g14627 [Coprinellus aureogranulatus]|nr:hypothetical protein NMY22_g14627 [Coprinellus aureogranulatus]
MAPPRQPSLRTLGWPPRFLWAASPVSTSSTLLDLSSSSRYPPPPPVPFFKHTWVLATALFSSASSTYNFALSPRCPSFASPLLSFFVRTVNPLPPYWTSIRPLGAIVEAGCTTTTTDYVPTTDDSSRWPTGTLADLARPRGVLAPRALTTDYIPTTDRFPQIAYMDDLLIPLVVTPRAPWHAGYPTSDSGLAESTPLEGWVIFEGSPSAYISFKLEARRMAM